MTKEEIGAILKQLRVSSGKTQKEVAEMIGRNQQVVGHWETGYSQPDANTLFILCDIYGTTVDDAFGFKKETVSKNDLIFLKKYHSLDPYGQETVNYILDREAARTAALNEKDVLIAQLQIKPANTRIIQYYQRLASAGTGEVIFEDMPVDRIEIPDIPEYKRVSYAIGVNGHSMEPLYYDGDMLLIEPTCQVDIGEIGIFIVGDKAYVKKLGNGELISLNAGYANIPLTEDSKCMGRVVDKYNL